MKLKIRKVMEIVKFADLMAKNSMFIQMKDYANEKEDTELLAFLTSGEQLTEESLGDLAKKIIKDRIPTVGSLDNFSFKVMVDEKHNCVTLETVAWEEKKNEETYDIPIKFDKVSVDTVGKK